MPLTKWSGIARWFFKSSPKNMFTDFREMKGETEKERERGRERQTDIDVRNIDRLPSVCTLSRD